MKPAEPRIEIVNIVATMKLEPMPNPGEILERIPGAKPLKKFRGAMIRIGRTPILFYKNKIVVAGAKSLEDLDVLVEELVETMRRHGFRVNPVSREIVNVTARAELGRRIDLRKAAEKLGGIYDPDYRPYVILKIDKVTTIVSQNGRVVLLGAPGIEHTNKTIRKILELLGYLSN